MKDVLYGICGPTASGKTELALRVCERLGGEIVSADSMQVYIGMDILSAMPDETERKRARHHLIGFVPAGQKYNASKYRLDAENAIKDIRARGALPLLCGGTGLYIDALTKDIKMSEEADGALRDRFKAIASQEGGRERLYELLSRLDPASAEKYDKNDTRRVIRSLEIYYQTGAPRSLQEKLDREKNDRFDARLFALKWDRAALYERIEKRVDNMLKQGLISEVEKLIKAGDAVQETASQAIGFKEIRAALLGETSMDEAIALIKTRTRHLAKRQETWFRRDRRVHWLETDGNNFETLTQQIIHYITEEKP